MYPILFAPDATSWDTFGICVLSDAIICEVEENRNGAYELEMTYPITGAHFNDIALRCLVLAKPNYTDNPQPFRIYAISKPLNGIVTVNAQHISYDLSGYVDAPFTESGIQAALARMLNAITITPSSCPFIFTSDMSGTSTMELKHPESVRALMGGIAGSLIDTFGGEWHFDGYNCALNAARGANRGVVIKYGKNMTDLKQEENNASVYTAVYPYYYNADTDVLVTIPEKTIQVTGSFAYSKVLPLDLTFDFEEAPSEAQLRSKAQSYINRNNIGVPDVNLTIKFVEADSFTDRVDLCDIVTVEFDTLGVAATAKCIRTKWDTLRNRYIEAELGSAKNSIAATIAGTKEIENAITERTSQFKTVASGIVSKVTGNTGGYIVLHDTNNDGEPDEILIMDSDDITLAVHIIRMNNSGIAFSSTGYNGTYTTAWNIDGEFVANFIASGELQTDRVTILGDSQFSWDDANIEIVDPSDQNKIIRFGKYDGTNYGLAFSTDGGTTWKSCFDFSGIELVDDTSNGYASMHGDSFEIHNASGVLITHVGNGTVNDGSGQYMTAPYYMLGTRRTGSDIGQYCFAAGRYSNPAGAYCVCAGYRNEVQSSYGLALGSNNTTVDQYCIAIGEACNSSGSGVEVVSGVTRHYGSIAIGQYTTAGDNIAIAIGHGCTAVEGVAIGSKAKSNDEGIAIGYEAEVTSDSSYSLAIGREAKAKKHSSVAIGRGAIASGEWSTAVGNGAKASNNYSTALGIDNTASGVGAFATGYESTASGNYSAAIGQGIKASSNYQFVCGRYNEAATNRFIVGNGTADNARSNALRLANSGNLWIAGTLTQGSDERQKDVIGEPPDVSGIRAVRFRWNDNKKNHDDIEHIGYLAQDVEKVAPYLIEEDENSEYKSLNYIEFLCAKIDSLERTVERLANRVAELEGVTA